MIELLASSMAGEDWGGKWMMLGNFGGIGVVLAWFLWKGEPRLRAIEAAIDRLVRIIAIFLIELPHVIDAVKTQCRAMTEELDKAEKARSGDPKE